MKPTDFPEANSMAIRPYDSTASQCGDIPIYRGPVQGGYLDGMDAIICAWKPEPEDLERLNAGGVVYLMAFGGISPHALTTYFPG